MANPVAEVAQHVRAGIAAARLTGDLPARLTSRVVSTRDGVRAAVSWAPAHEDAERIARLVLSYGLAHTPDDGKSTIECFDGVCWVFVSCATRASAGRVAS